MKCHRSKCRRKATRPGQLCHQHYDATPHGYVDVAPARNRIAALKAAGYSWTELAKLTGLSEPTLKLAGTKAAQPTVWLDTHQRVMAVPIPTGLVSGRGVLPAAGTQRRIRALMAGGWTQTHLATECGFSDPRTVSEILNRRRFVFSETAFRVAEAFNKLQMTQGPSVALQKRGQNSGWIPAFAWDEDTIDDPTAKPDVGKRVSVSADERIAELRDDLGISDIHHIAFLLGIKPESVERQLDRSAA